MFASHVLVLRWFVTSLVLALWMAPGQEPPRPLIHPSFPFLLLILLLLLLLHLCCSCSCCFSCKRSPCLKTPSLHSKQDNPDPWSCPFCSAVFLVDLKNLPENSFISCFLWHLNFQRVLFISSFEGGIWTSRGHSSSIAFLVVFPTERSPWGSSKPQVIVSGPKLYHIMRGMLADQDALFSTVVWPTTPVHLPCESKHFDAAFSLLRSTMLVRLGCNSVRVEGPNEADTLCNASILFWEYLSPALGEALHCACSSMLLWQTRCQLVVLPTIAQKCAQPSLSSSDLDGAMRGSYWPTIIH